MGPRRIRRLFAGRPARARADRLATPLFSLPPNPLSSFFSPGDRPRGPSCRIPLVLPRSRCKLNRCDRGRAARRIIIREDATSRQGDDRGREDIPAVPPCSPVFCPPQDRTRRRSWAALPPAGRGPRAPVGASGSSPTAVGPAGGSRAPRAGDGRRDMGDNNIGGRRFGLPVNPIVSSFFLLFLFSDSLSSPPLRMP